MGISGVVQGSGKNPIAGIISVCAGKTSPVKARVYPLALEAARQRDDLLAALENLLVHEHAVGYALASRPQTESSWAGACKQARAAVARVWP